ncbi:actin binding protein [Metarhizium album ARSEF 1941]|uniref:Actin binding protein n=1 Tax=Metarhizium album (strain ARSEF 1941) TaxID=1081103 RepID=A0A0B2WR54_METAS|nr:actin binding protein [Metarhizium album ARSEF 1941]KHN98541.1 actin binding protein [Metarhizium album ARSEF 1941]
MASLNLSINGPSIKSSYNSVVNGPAPAGVSATLAQWALFAVQAPLMNAFQDSGSKESILKVENTGGGELADLLEDFNEGRIQFAFVKVKDPNTSLPKNVLIAWCGGGVPERTKGYFTSHLNAVANVLHGYHVQITARSDSDLDPESIMQKVADASGAKYSAGAFGGLARAAPPPVKSKPVFTPTSSSTGREFDPLVAARSRRDDNADEEGWGVDAPPVTRTEIERVEPAYKPTKVNMAELTKQQPEPSRFDGSSRQSDGPSDVVGGGYQPVGKVDIAAIRAAAQRKEDDRPTPVKGAYEPVGKVDIAAIRARAQKPAEPREEKVAAQPKPLADRDAALSQPVQSERITALPKPKVANKFGGASTFTGTKAPNPGGLGFAGPAPSTAAPVGSASRTFADQGGKTPAQLWAEKKARKGGSPIGSRSLPAAPVSVTAQASGGQGWKSGYTGKSWSVQAPGYSRDGPVENEQQHGDDRQRGPADEADDSASGVSALRDRFKDASLIGPASTPPDEQSAPPPPVPDNSRPSGGFALPSLPSRPSPTDGEEEEADGQPTTYEPSQQREPSPIRVAAPVARAPEPEPELEEEPEPEPAPERRPLPPALPNQEPEPPIPEVGGPAEPEPETEADHGAAAEGHRAVIMYDYEKAEGNEIDLMEGQIVINIDMVDEDWWMGTNHLGESGLFPSNYVELIKGETGATPAAAPAAGEAPSASSLAARAVPSAPATAKPTATALYDYEAAEDNELSFPEDAKITNLEFPDDDWWFGHYGGHAGLFPSNYVQVDPKA